MHQLTRAAVDWWTTYTAAHGDAGNISWTEFKSTFCNHHVPMGEIKLKHRELLYLKVHESESTSLVGPSYPVTPPMTWTLVKRSRTASSRKNPGFCYALSNVDYDRFQRLVDKAFVMEKERKRLEEDRKRRMA